MDAAYIGRWKKKMGKSTKRLAITEHVSKIQPKTIWNIVISDETWV